ncbi:MAG: helix-turn-helix transcriptional regulator [Lachnospiraceae bacterium]|nr:helix-turn-helix transcriptional regulator [Lachnospiraceae bacterium]
MAVSYNGLWKILIDKNLQKKDLTEQLNISSTTIAKMGKGEQVSMNVLERICTYLDCNIGDIMRFEKEENGDGSKQTWQFLYEKRMGN